LQQLYESHYRYLTNIGEAHAEGFTSSAENLKRAETIRRGRPLCLRNIPGQLEKSCLGRISPQDYKTNADLLYSVCRDHKREESYIKTL